MMDLGLARGIHEAVRVGKIGFEMQDGSIRELPFDDLRTLRGSHRRASCKRASILTTAVTRFISNRSWMGVST